MGANYSVLVGVEFQKGNVQSKLNSLVKDATVKVKPELDTTEKAKVKKELDELVKDYKAKIKVELDGAKEAEDGLDGAKKSADEAKKSIDDLQLSYQAANAIFRETKEILSDMFEQVVTFDDSLTEFKKVSDLSGQALDDYTSKLSDMGTEVARTGKPNRSEPACTDGKCA